MKLRSVVACLLLVAGCEGTDSLSGVWTGDGTAAICNGSGSPETSDANDQIFRVRDDGDSLVVTWQACSVAATRTSAGEGRSTWTIANQSCTLDGVASIVHGDVTQPGGATAHLAIVLRYHAANTSSSCESYIDATVAR